MRVGLAAQIGQSSPARLLVPERAHPSVQAAQGGQDPRHVIERVTRIHRRLRSGWVAVMGDPPTKFAQVVHMLQPHRPHIGLLHANGEEKAQHILRFHAVVRHALLAQSAIDRLTSRAHTLIIEGPSYRQRNRLNQSANIDTESEAL